MRRFLAPLLAALLAACATLAETANPAPDAPEAQSILVGAFKDAASYSQALQVWRTAEDVNAWIGARFRYDMSRAMLLSESRRGRSGPLPIYPAPDFFADSKRPGHIAGPYRTAAQFIAEYSVYRNRTIIAFRALDSHQRKQRTLAPKQSREERRP